MTNTRLNPYVGPRPFQPDETVYGRKRDLKELLSLLIAERLLLFYSPSGAGKTSLIQTTLIPMLEDEDFMVLPVMRVSSGVAWSVSVETDAAQTSPDMPASDRAGEQGGEVGSGAKQPDVRKRSRTRRARTERPLNRYILSLLISLEADVPPGQQCSLDELKCMTLSEYLDQRAQRMATLTTESDNADEDDNADDYEDEPEYLVLIFDQFEEILLIDPTNHEARKDFFEQVGAALNEPHRWAIFAVREDYIASLRSYLRPIPTRLNNTYRLDLLVEERARTAIQEPARQHGVTFDAATLEQLLNDLRRIQVYDQLDGSMQEVHGHHIDPIQLQVVCYRLWQKLSPDQTHITLTDLSRIDPVRNALSSYYTDCIRAVASDTNVAEQIIRSWIEDKLITRQGMRGKVLQEPEQSQGLDNHIIARLVDTYLVRAEQQRDTTWFELAHERMITPIRQSNAAWREDHLNMLRHKEAQKMAHQQQRQRHSIYGLSVVAILVTFLALFFFLRSQHEHARAKATVAQLTVLSLTTEALDEQASNPILLMTAEALVTETVLALQQTQAALAQGIPPPLLSATPDGPRHTINSLVPPPTTPAAPTTLPPVEDVPTPTREPRPALFPATATPFAPQPTQPTSNPPGLQTATARLPLAVSAPTVPPTVSPAPRATIALTTTIPSPAATVPGPTVTASITSTEALTTTRTRLPE